MKIKVQIWRAGETEDDEGWVFSDDDDFSNPIELLERIKKHIIHTTVKEYFA